MSRPLSVVFASYHAAFDPSNGAARTMRDIMQLLRQAGVETASLTGACVDAQVGRAREITLATLAAEERTHDVHGDVVATSDRGTPSLAWIPDVPSAPDPPEAERTTFIELARRLFRATRPDVVLTYGGGAIGREIMRVARDDGASVVFRIMNFRYQHKELFDDVAGVLVPARFVGQDYERRLSLETTTIPCPLDWSRTEAPSGRRRFLTYVAPTPEKGAPWAARIFEDLSRVRPDIPLLVVEGRGHLESFAQLLGARAREQVFATRTVADPRTFLAETRVLLMPSYVEPSGRLAQEAVINELPVVASDRGGLPETLAHAGIVLPITGGFDPRYLAVPPSSRVAPWLATIERLWDEPTFYASERARALEARERWRPARLAAEYLAYFEARRRTREAERETPSDWMRDALARARDDEATVHPPARLEARRLKSLLHG